MALKIKAKERLMKFNKESEGTYRYVMVPDLYSTLDQTKVIREAALRSGVSEGVMHACWDAAGEVIKAWATEGHSVALPGLGSMRFGLSARSVADVNEVKTSLIKTRRIVFTPSVELKDELKNTNVYITCYDRDGNVVKRVSSTDNAPVEDGDDPDDGITVTVETLDLRILGIPETRRIPAQAAEASPSRLAWALTVVAASPSRRTAPLLRVALCRLLPATRWSSRLWLRTTTSSS